MGTTLEVNTILILTIVAMFFIYFVLYRKDRKMAGLATIMLGISLTSLTNYMANIGTYIMASVIIICVVGIYMVLDGAVNKR